MRCPSQSSATTSAFARASVAAHPAPLHFCASSRKLHVSVCADSDAAAAAAMTALYKPTEAISFLRPSLLLPRVQAPSSTRRPRAAFSTTRHAQATPSFPGSPAPMPPRKSITLTGDTGRVHWNALSPGEKVVRTTQQSFNLVVVAIGVIATVRTRPHTCHRRETDTSRAA